MEDPETSPDTDVNAAALARELLAWYRAAGVEDGVGEDAIDWFQRGDVRPGAAFELSDVIAGGRSAAAPGMRTTERPEATPPAKRQAPTTAPPDSERSGGNSPAARQFPTTPPDEAVMAARTAARSASSLDELRTALENFNGCALKATAKNLCFFRGPPRARLMIIGEAPGREEDLAGTPFVGPAGKLLERMLASAGIAETQVHITNIVYWRPPGNRTPSPQETQTCRPFLDRQIELVEPEIIALLGGAAANTVLGIAGGITRLRGTWREVDIGERKFKVMASLHPAFLLRTPAYKRQAWRDFLTIADALGVPTSAAKAG